VTLQSLKSQNILYDAVTGSAKVADFGMTTEMDKSAAHEKAAERRMTAHCGTREWMAPELCASQVLIDEKIKGASGDTRDIAEIQASRREFIQQHERVLYGQKVDVYAFGVTLYEIMSHQVPWKDTPKEAIYKKVCAGDRPSLNASPEDAPRDWVEVMHLCWNQDPGRRPAFDLIHVQLKRCRSTYNALCDDYAPFDHNHIVERLTIATAEDQYYLLEDDPAQARTMASSAGV